MRRKPRRHPHAPRAYGHPHGPFLKECDDKDIWSDQHRATTTWAQAGPDLLPRYEYRALIKFGDRTLSLPEQAIDDAYQRVCVDLRTLSSDGSYRYYQMPPQHRLWIWENLAQVAAAGRSAPPRATTAMNVPSPAQRDFTARTPTSAGSPTSRMS